MRNTFALQNFLADYLRTKLDEAAIDVVVNEYEPGERGHQFLNSKSASAVYVFLDRTSIDDGEASQFDQQQIRPAINFDIYVAAKANEQNGVLTSSIISSHRKMEALATAVYEIIMDQTVKDSIESALGVKIEKFFFKTCEKGGILDRPESKRAAVLFRMTLNIGLEERNAGYDGVALSEIVDTIEANEVT